MAYGQIQNPEDDPAYMAEMLRLQEFLRQGSDYRDQNATEPMLQGNANPNLANEFKMMEDAGWFAPGQGSGNALRDTIQPPGSLNTITLGGKTTSLPTAKEDPNSPYARYEAERQQQLSQRIADDRIDRANAYNWNNKTGVPDQQKRTVPDFMAAQQEVSKRELDRQAKIAQIAEVQARKDKLESDTRNADLKDPNKPPAGFERTEDGSGLRAIPGGPADFKQAGMFNTDTATLQSSNADLDRLATSANEILKSPGLSRITGIVGAFPNIPGSDAANAEAKLLTLKSQVGFGVLQAMRNASKTGGALGNVSDAEGKRLEANLAALDKAQSYDQFKESLQKIIDFSTEAKGRLAGAYNLKYNKDDKRLNSADKAPTAEKGEVPPKEGRVVGQYYPTPIGKLMWLGNGWAKPK